MQFLPTLFIPALIELRSSMLRAGLHPYWLKLPTADPPLILEGVRDSMLQTVENMKQR